MEDKYSLNHNKLLLIYSLLKIGTLTMSIKKRQMNLITIQMYERSSFFNLPQKHYVGLSNQHIVLSLATSLVDNLWQVFCEKNTFFLIIECS